MSNFNAMLGVDFSLIGTKLHAAYEKNNKGYSVLLLPSEQEADNSVSIGEVIRDIQKMLGSSDGTKDMENNLKNQLGSTGNVSGGLDSVFVKLNMAYLYIQKTEGEKDSVLEYAFQLEVITDGFVPKEIRDIVDVTHLSLSIWQTDRKKVVDKMRLVTINDYLEIPVSNEGAGEQPTPQPEEQEQKEK